MEPLIGANNHQAKETNHDNGKLETAPPTPNAIATAGGEQPHNIEEVEVDEKLKTITTTHHHKPVSNGSTMKEQKSPIMTSLTVLTSSPPKDNQTAEDTENDVGGDGDGDVAISEYIIKSSSCQ